jgi:alcohol dehydrogenase class IV
MTKAIDNNWQEQLSTLLNKQYFKRIFLVTGKSSYTSSGAQASLNDIFRSTSVKQFNSFSANPKLDDALSGVKEFNADNYDAILAVGGGSVIDMAKLIKAFSSLNENPGEKIISNHPWQIKHIPLIAIPTTYGSGSEATEFAVIYIDNKKYSISHPALRPDNVFLIPELTYNIPHNIAASCAFDAFSQAIESLWSINSTAKSTQYSLKAIELILPNIVDAVQGNNKQACQAMLTAANLSGKAINIAKTTAAHAISYTLTSKYNIPHGHAVALTLGKFIYFNFNIDNTTIINDKRGRQHLEKVKTSLCKAFNSQTIIQCMNRWYELMKKVGLKLSLNDFHITTKKQLQDIIDNINIQRLANNPLEISKPELLELLRRNTDDE